MMLILTLVVGLIPLLAIPARAAPQTDIPQNMLDNPVLRSLKYLGYDLDQQIEDGTLYVLYGYDTEVYMPETYVRYPKWKEDDEFPTDGVRCE